MRIPLIKFSLLSLFLSLILNYGCTSNTKVIEEGGLVVKTTGTIVISQTTASVSGSVSADGGTQLVSRGICYSTSASPTTADATKLDPTASTGNFSCTLANLNPSTTYYAKAFVTTASGPTYGETMSFTTQAAITPILSATTVSSITTTGALLSGNVTHSGKSSVTSRGFCYSATAATPTISDTKVTNSTSGTGTFSNTITGLTEGVRYYVRAFATNNEGTGYSDVVSFNATSIVLPTLNTPVVSSITASGASLAGNVTDSGQSSIISRGFCYSTTVTSPTTSDTKVTNSIADMGIFSNAITGLTDGTTYYVRAFATNSKGTAYSPAVSFTTPSTTIPSLATSSVNATTATGATLTGNITNNGRLSITSRGFCYSTSVTTPTTADTKVSNSTDAIGSFSINLSGLTDGTTYYARAFATNSKGTAYSDVFTFATKATTVPTIATTITASDYSVTGELTNEGGLTTERGFCYSTTVTNPTTADLTIKSTSTGTGSFSSDLSSMTLTLGTKYYVRAYAKNSKGTVYSDSIYFIYLKVGDTYQGGKVAYIYQSGESGYIEGEKHGLIVAVNFSSIIMTWNDAMGISSSYSADGYGDWYLPSISELQNGMYNLAFNTPYWSSTESGGGSYAYTFSLNTGQMTASKSTNYKFIPVRRF